MNIWHHLSIQIQKVNVETLCIGSRPSCQLIVSSSIIKGSHDISKMGNTKTFNVYEPCRSNVIGASKESMKDLYNNKEYGYRLLVHLG